MIISKLNYVNLNKINFTANKNKKNYNQFNYESDSFQRSDARIVNEEFEKTFDGKLKSSTVALDNGSVVRTSFYRNKSVKEHEITFPSGYKRCHKYHKNGVIKEKIVTYADGNCTEKIVYNKNGLPKRASRKWSNGVYTKLSKDYKL